MKSIIPNLRKNIIAMLYALGLSLSILSIFGMYSVMLRTCLLLLAMGAASVVFSISKRSRLITLIGLAALFAVLLVSGMFSRFLFSCIQLFKALALFFMGSSNIFLAYAPTFAVLAALLSFFIAKMFSDEYISFIPMMLLLVIAMYVILQIGAGLDYLYTLPAWLAVLYKALNKKKTLDLKSNIAVALIVAISFALLPLAMHPVKPLNKMAKDIKERIRDYFFFTEEREIFSIDDYGYYPYGIGRFGGKPEIDDSPVLTVETDKKLLLRGITKDYYNGLSFQNTHSTSRYLFVNPRWRGLRSRSLLEKYPLGLTAEGLLRESSHKVSLYSEVHTTLLLPVYLRKIVTNNDMIPYFNETGEVFITRNLQPNDSYTFSVPIVEGGMAGLDVLVERAASMEDPLYEQMYREYSQLPDHLEGAVQSLLEKITRDASTPYGKALAIMNYLKSSYKYRLNVKEPPANVDFVTHFLFQSKEGYCTYFAASMTVLARMAGLPARYVEGFVANPDSDNLARITGKEAHAWTEVYFKGFGWVPFDATAPNRENRHNNPPPPENQNNPDAPTPTPPPPEESETPPEEDPQPEEPSPQPEETPTPTPPPEPENPLPNQDKSAPDLPFLWVLLFLLTMLVSALFVWLSQPLQAAKNEESQEKRVRIYSRACMLILNNWSKKIPKYDSTKTIFDYAAEINPHFPVDLIHFANAVSRLVYSKNQDLDWEEQTTRSTYKILFSKLNWIRKVKLVLLYAWMAFRE